MVFSLTCHTALNLVTCIRLNDAIPFDLEVRGADIIDDLDRTWFINLKKILTYLHLLMQCTGVSLKTNFTGCIHQKKIYLGSHTVRSKVLNEIIVH